MVVYLNHEPAFRALSFSIPGVEIDVSGAGDHVDMIDVRIRDLKEVMRSVSSNLKSWMMT